MNDILLEFLQAGPAHMPYLNAFENIPQKIRHKRISDDTSTIWEELEHIRLAQEDIINYMTDAAWESPEWPAGYWPPKREHINDHDWQSSVKGFRNDLNKLCSFVSGFQGDLIIPLPHAPQHSYLREILLIIDHNAYHMAKIIAIRKYFSNLPG
jgi:hypothetical protein